MVLVIPLGWYGYLNGIDPAHGMLRSASLVRDRIQRARATELDTFGSGVDAGNVFAIFDERVRHEVTT